MNNLRSLTNVLSDLSDIAIKIVAKYVKLADLISHSETRYVDAVVKQVEGVTRERASELLQTTSMEYLTDVKRVRKELPDFIIEEEGRSYHVNHECKFLMEVWKGDAYDKAGVDGLRELLEDLRGQLRKISPDGLVEMVVDRLRSGALLKTEKETTKAEIEKIDAVKTETKSDVSAAVVVQT